jgi:hypothetical protein
VSDVASTNVGNSSDVCINPSDVPVPGVSASTLTDNCLADTVELTVPVYD